MDLVDLRPAFDNYSERRRPPRIIIVHHTSTPHPANTREVLARRGLSTHAEVTKEGLILLYLDAATTASWHAGSPNNSDSIGIDLTHLQDEPFPQAQLDALAWLLRYYADTFAIPLTLAPDRCVITHAPGCGDLTDAPALIRQGYGVARHRNVHTTICPDNLPLEQVVAAARSTGGGGGILLPALAAVGGFLAFRYARRRNKR